MRSYYKAYEYFKKNNLMDADAFICVNDQTALGVYYMLNKDGYKVPEDYAVTGYDHIPQAAYNIPSITSAERYESMIGRSAYLSLFDKDKNDVKIRASLAVGSSCCKGEQCSVKLKDKYLKDCIKRSMELSRFSEFINRSSADFMTYQSSVEMYAMLPGYQERFNIPSMTIVLDPDKKRNKLDVAYHYNIKNKGKESITLERDQIYDEDDGDLYVYSSLHYNDVYFGYVVVTDYMSATDNELYQTFINNISNMYESIKKYSKQEEYISKLKDISYYDPLTKLYNRLGFFKKAEKEFKLARENNVSSYIIFADLDGLKRINDMLGHKMGDEYITDFANILLSSITESDIVMRYGGDEFVIFGLNKDKETLKKFIEDIHLAIRSFNKAGKFSPYILSVSIGYSIIPADTEQELYNFIESADEKMYKVKTEKKNDTENRSGKDRRSGRDRRVADRRSLNVPLDFS